MAMPWSLPKEKRRKYLSGELDRKQLTALFDACFRIQREAIEAAGRHIPLVVENVRGAQEWVGRSQANYGSFHLWGSVPWNIPALRMGGTKNTGGSWFNIGSPGQKVTNQTPVHALAGQKTVGHANKRDGHSHTRHLTNQAESDGIKCGGDWFNASQPSIIRLTGSKSPARKAASAQIAKIPLPLARHIAAYWHPRQVAA